MARTYVRVSPDSTGKKVATDEVADGLDTVERQIIRTAGAAPAELQDVRNVTPGAGDYGAVVRHAGPIATLGTLVPEEFDYIGFDYASTTDTLSYRLGGAGGTLVATLTITYTDSGKGTITSVART